MKTKTKILAAVEIAIVLCSLFLVALPAISAEQNQEIQEVSASTITTASEEGYVLGVYGNANEDDTIDMRDLTYVKLIFFGKKPETELADAKYDGKINPLDFIQIKLIIVGKEKELTLIDSAETKRTVTIPQPIERIAGLHTSPCREFCMLEVEDKVVGVTKYILDDLDMYPGLEGKPNIGSVYEPNYEIIAEAKPQVLIMTESTTRLEPVVKKLEPLGIKVVALGLRPSKYGGATEYEREHYYNYELKLLGYILDKEERAGDFIEWKQEIIELIEDRTKDLKGEEKVRVFGTGLSALLRGETGFYASRKFIELAGGIDIGAEVPSGAKVSGEWVLKKNPDAIILFGYYTKEGFGYSVTDGTLAKQSLSIALEHEVLRETKAAKEGKIYIFGYYGTGSGGQIQLGALYLAKRIYPERFEDVDPQKFHKEYFEKWFGIPYQGVWVYP